MAATFGLEGMWVVNRDVDVDGEPRHLRALRHAGGITDGADPLVLRLRHKASGLQRPPTLGARYESNAFATPRTAVQWQVLEPLSLKDPSPVGAKRQL